MRKRYYTQLTNDRPELIEVNVKLTQTQLAKIRRLTDSKPSDSIQEMLRKLINQKTSKSISKVYRSEY